VLLLLLL